MAKKIEFTGTGDGANDVGVHFEHYRMDYTLCGLTLDGDTMTTGGYEVTTKRVNCSDCKEIVAFSKSIKNSEME